MNPDTAPDTALAPTTDDGMKALAVRVNNATLERPEELHALLADLGTAQRAAVVLGFEEAAVNVSIWKDRLLERLSLDTGEFPTGKGNRGGSISRILPPDSPIRRAVKQWRSDWLWDTKTTDASREAVRKAAEAAPEVLTRAVIRKAARGDDPQPKARNWEAWICSQVNAFDQLDDDGKAKMRAAVKKLNAKLNPPKAKAAKAAAQSGKRPAPVRTGAKPAPLFDGKEAA